MGTIYTTAEVEVEISEIIESMGVYDIEKLKKTFLRRDLKKYYSDGTNVDPIVAIRLLKEAGVDLQKLNYELDKWFKNKVVSNG